jgi:hypothetical protein
MAEFTVWARGDSSSANNASINSENTNQTPTTELTFTSGATGDLELEFNDGGEDPDTQVIIDGVTYDFTLDFSGYMPYTNALSNVAGVDVRGAEVVVITVDTGQRYYFLTDGSGTFEVMDDMPNGAIPIDALNTSGPILLCFAAGTMISTPLGERRVEDLVAGEFVRLEDGRDVPINWIGRRHVTAAELSLYPNLRPVVVPAHSFGPERPYQDLRLSRQHRVLIEGWEVELNFGTDRILVPVGHLVGDAVHVDHRCDEVTYFHILLETHDILISNGMPSESFLPGGHAVAGLDEDTRQELFQLFPDLGDPNAARMQDAADSLNKRQATVLHITG